MSSTTPAAQPRRAPLLRLRTVIGATALAAAALVATTPAAQAESQEATSSQLKWGFKSSWRTYVSTFGGTATASDGATKDSASPTAPYTWSGNGGSYDPETGAGALDFSGKVVFAVPSHSIWNITVANPTVVLDGDGTGSLVADVSYATGGTASAPENSGSQTNVAIADVTAVDPTVNGTDYTFTNLDATLTDDGAEAFGGFYEVGEKLDPLTFTATLEGEDDPTDPEEPTEPPANPIADLVKSTTDTVNPTLVSLLTLVRGLFIGLG
jgi:hypothetical protein